jgi:hypothetical protein
MTVPVEALRSLEPRQAAAWLRANGWELVHTRPEHTATWRKAAGVEGDFLIELPLDVTFRDYARRMGEVLDTLVVATGKPPAWLLEELRASSFDIIRLRSTGPGIADGRVPIELGVRLFRLTRDLLEAAARSTLHPRLYHGVNRPPMVSDFLHRVMLASPADGSFTITAYVPIHSEGASTPTQERDELPFGRRTTLTLAAAVSAARDAAAQEFQSSDGQHFLPLAARGISANLCEALAGFVEGGEATSLHLQVAWAASTTPMGSLSEVYLDSKHASMLRAGSMALRAASSRGEVTLSGRVVRLTSTNPEAGGMALISGTVDGQQLDVDVQMGPADYAVAQQAYDSGQLVTCEGVLRRRIGGTLHMRQVGRLTLAGRDG